MKISNFIIGMIVVSLFISLLGIYYSNIAVQYSKDFNDTSFAGYDQLTTINNDLSNINSTLQSLKQESGITDLLGGFLSSGYTAIKATFTSFSAFFDMASTATEQSTVLGASSQYLSSHLILIVMVLFFFAVIAVIVGRDV